VLLWNWSFEEQKWMPTQLEPATLTRITPQLWLVPQGKARCVLLSGDGVRVNGVLTLPIQVLQDRDEIQLQDHVFYFSTESPAELGPFPNASEPLPCGRCKGQMKAGDPAVQCSCGRWYHQTGELNCYTHDSVCACGRSTAGFTWLPEPLSQPEENSRDH
jgi:hypothetical protein